MGATDISIIPNREVIIPTTVFMAGAATDVPIVSQGTTGQTGNLQEWQDSTGTVLSRVANNGVFIGPAANFSNNLGAAVTVLTVRGQTGQTGNLVDFVDGAGTTLTRIDSDGIIRPNAKIDYTGHFLFGGS